MTTMTSELLWYDYLSTLAMIVLLLTLLYGWVERRTGGEPGLGYMAMLSLCLASAVPEAWAESDRIMLVGAGFAAGTVCMAAVWRRDTVQNQTRR